MAKKRKAPAPLDLYALDPAAKRSIEVEARRAAEIKGGPRFAARPKSTGSLSRPRRGGIERTADRLYEAGLPLSVTDAIKSVDRNLLGLDDTAQSLRNVMNDEAGAGDYVNLALSSPVGALALKPLELGARGIGRAAMRGGRRALDTRAGRYLTEARPLMDNADDAVEAAFTVMPGAQRRITNQRPRVQGLPAPAQRLGLPAPGPGMPDYAAKPRGGQWWTTESPYDLLNPAVSTRENVYLGQRFSSNPGDKAFVEWWDKALPRYIQNDFATPDDPLRALADQGYLQGIENAAQWSNRVKQDVTAMPLQKLLFDEKVSNTKDEALASMPWLSKIPQTDSVYGFWPREETIGALSHIRDELVNALKPDISGIPADLAVRPESLARMSFPQAAERVGRINQWRAKQQEQAALSAMDSPVVHTFKEYSENNPMGLRWVEMAPPKEGVPTNYDPAEELARALKYEGDTMGHCVGGYCPDVMSGRSRIFSLRDARGEPHVTVETKAGDPTGIYRAELARMRESGELAPWTEWLRQKAADPAYQPGMDGLKTLNEWRADAGLEPLEISVPDDIKQIKGKQNRAPKEDYLPFVQDFVKSGQWGEIGDFENTGLFNRNAALEAIAQTREIHPQQQQQLLDRIINTIASEGGNPDVIDEWDPPRGFEDVWLAAVKAGRGYARGGRALAAKPCSCDKSLAVR